MKWVSAVVKSLNNCFSSQFYQKKFPSQEPIVHGLWVKLLSNWEHNLLYNKSYKFYEEKEYLC